MLSSAVIAMSLMTQTAVGKMAVVRTFATNDEIGRLIKSITEWDAIMPCAEPATRQADLTSQVDLILVYSKDIGTNPQARTAVEAYEASFAQGQTWTGCFAGIEHMSAGLMAAEDQYDEHGYAMNKHWVTGPNMVFMRSMEAFYTGAFVGEYSNIFWMEVDAVPVMSGWLDKFEEEAAEMLAKNMAIRGSLYSGSNWQPFSYMMPTYILNHINGNAIYNLEHEWSKFLFNLIKAPENGQVMEEMAFDTAYSAISEAAMTGSNTMLAEAWAARNGSATTYSSETQLVRNYANTLLNKSHDVGAYIRHGSISNIFDSLSGEEVTLGVAALSQQNDHFMSSIGTNHPFKNILLLTYDSTDVETQTIPAPGGDVTLSVEASEQSPMMGLCEVAAKVKTPWFAVTTNYHIINAPVSVLMHMGQPVLPYLLASSSYCMDRPDCKASLEQAEELFGIKLNYHHDVTEEMLHICSGEALGDPITLLNGQPAALSVMRMDSLPAFCELFARVPSVEGLHHQTTAPNLSRPCTAPARPDSWQVLFNTTETESFCAAWTLAAGDKSLEDCQLVSGPSADDFMAWKLSLGMSITGTARERTRYGWRSWTTLWEPLPVDTRNCSVYGFEEYADTLAYISNCSLNVENASACNANGACRWEPMFETGVCLPDRPGLSTTVNITASSSTGSTTTSSSTTTTVCSPVLDFSIEIMEGICDLSNWGMLSADAVSCEPATTPFVQLALANKMFSHCGAWCLFDFNQPDEVSFYWNNAEKCFQQSGFCNSEHPDEQELAVARQKSFCSTTTTSTGTSTTSTTTVQHVIQLPADVSVNTVEGRIVESTLWEALALMEMQADSLLTATAWGNVTVAKLRSLAADFDSSDRVVFSTDIAGGVRGVTVSVPLQLVQNLMQGANPMLAVTEVLPHVSETMPSNGEGSSQVVLNSPVVEISILLEAQGRVSVATVSDLAEPILVRLSDASQQPQDVCAFFDHTSRAWSSVGLQAISVNDLSGRWCQSTHLSILAIVHVVPFEGLIAEQDTSFELTSIALACASLFAGGGVVFLLWYYRCKPARGGSVQIQGKGDQTFVVTYSRSTRSADHEPDEPMKSISTKSLSFQAFRSEASASAASKVHIEWNIQANDWKTRLHDLEGWTGDLKQHHATQAAEVGRGRPGPASTDATKDAPDLLATLKRAETAAMEEAERLDFLVEVDAPVPVDSLQVAEDPQKAARPSFYRNGEAVLYFSITNQCWLLARIQGDPAWMNSEEQIDRDFLPTGELPHYDCILPGPKQLRHRVPLSQLRQRLRCGESVHVHVEEVTHGRRSRASRTWSWKSGHIHKIPPVAMTTVDPYAVTLSSGDKINVDLGRIRRFYETGSRVRVFRGRHGWHYGTVFEDAVEAATTTSDSLLAKSMESVNADKHIQVRLDGTDDVVPMSCYLVHSCLFSF